MRLSVFDVASTVFESVLSPDDLDRVEVSNVVGCGVGVTIASELEAELEAPAYVEVSGSEPRVLMKIEKESCTEEELSSETGCADDVSCLETGCAEDLDAGLPVGVIGMTVRPPDDEGASVEAEAVDISDVTEFLPIPENVDKAKVSWLDGASDDTAASVAAAAANEPVGVEPVSVKTAGLLDVFAVASGADVLPLLGGTTIVAVASDELVLA